jgi:hypothetical protein
MCGKFATSNDYEWLAISPRKLIGAKLPPFRYNPLGQERIRPQNFGATLTQGIHISTLVLLNQVLACGNYLGDASLVPD